MSIDRDPLEDVVCPDEAEQARRLMQQEQQQQRVLPEQRQEQQLEQAPPPKKVDPEEAFATASMSALGSPHPIKPPYHGLLRR